MTDSYWEEAQKRLDKRRKQLALLFKENDPQLWDELARLVTLEDYARFCRQGLPADKIPLARLAACRPETIRAYLQIRKTRDEQGDVPEGAFLDELLAELEEHGLALANEGSIHLFDAK